jgi:pyruvate formate lyase activating enzyme
MFANVLSIKHYEIHDGDGVRSTVFLKGCPVRCKWCHNPEGLLKNSQLGYYSHKCINCGECVLVCPRKAHKIENGLHTFDRDLCMSCGKCSVVCGSGALKMFGIMRSAENVAEELLRDQFIYEATGGGVTVSGGEPTLQADFCVELFKILKEKNVNIALDTSLYSSWENIEKLLPYVDTYLVDLKFFDAKQHQLLTGVDNQIILENLKKLDKEGKSIEIRIPYVPTLNDDTVEKYVPFLKTLNNLKAVKILPYHNYATEKYEALSMDYSLKDILVPTENELNKQRQILRDSGINVIEE